MCVRWQEPAVLSLTFFGCIWKSPPTRGLITYHLVNTTVLATPIKNRRAVNRRARQNKTPIRGSMNPPQIRSNVIVGHRFRFISTNATRTSITAASLLAAAGNICTTANSVVTSFYTSVKLNRVEMWAPPPSQGSSVTASVLFSGAINSPNIEISDTSVSVSQPCHVIAVPPPNSIASFWQIGASGTVFQLNAPVGCIIDVWLDLICGDADQNPVNTAVATGTLTNHYYLSLDPVATSRYTPVSLTTTT